MLLKIDTFISFIFNLIFSGNIFIVFISPQTTLSSLSNFEKEEQSRMTLPDIKLCYKVTVIETVWYGHKNRHRSMTDTLK